MKSGLAVVIAAWTVGAWAPAEAAQCVGGSARATVVVREKIIAHQAYVLCRAELLDAPSGDLRVTYSRRVEFVCPWEGDLQEGDYVSGSVIWKPGMISKDGHRMWCLPEFTPEAPRE